MITALTEAWTTDSFLAWEDRQERKHEFDGHSIIPMTGGSLGHQRIVRNLLLALINCVDDQTVHVAQEMRVRAAGKIRYPDVCIFSGRFDQTTRTLHDADAIFEVLSDETEATDRVEKLLDYAALPSLRSYILLEQTAIAATVFEREPGGPWNSTPYTSGAFVLPGLGITLSLPDLYRGLTLAA